MKTHDSFDYNLRDISLGAYGDIKRAEREAPPIVKTTNRDRLFWDFRYQKRTYKARKAGISNESPSVLMKYGGDMFRLYGDAESNKLFGAAKGILAGWKARHKAETKILKEHWKLWLKENHKTARATPFDYWRQSLAAGEIRI